MGSTISTARTNHAAIARQPASPRQDACASTRAIRLASGPAAARPHSSSLFCTRQQQAEGPQRLPSPSAYSSSNSNRSSNAEGRWRRVVVGAAAAAARAAVAADEEVLVEGGAAENNRMRLLVSVGTAARTGVSVLPNCLTAAPQSQSAAARRPPNTPARSLTLARAVANTGRGTLFRHSPSLALGPLARLAPPPRRKHHHHPPPEHRPNRSGEPPGRPRTTGPPRYGGPPCPLFAVAQS